MFCTTPGFPVHHQLPQLAQTHVGTRYFHQNWLVCAKRASSASIRERDSEIQFFSYPSPSPLGPLAASQGSFPALFCFSSGASEAGHSPSPRFSFAAETGGWSFRSSNAVGGSDGGQYMKIPCCRGRSCECTDWDSFGRKWEGRCVFYSPVCCKRVWEGIGVHIQMKEMCRAKVQGAWEGARRFRVLSGCTALPPSTSTHSLASHRFL